LFEFVIFEFDLNVIQQPTGERVRIPRIGGGGWRVGEVKLD
jgi:hypothetical protein